MINDDLMIFNDLTYCLIETLIIIAIILLDSFLTAVKVTVKWDEYVHSDSLCVSLWLTLDHVTS